LSQYEPDTYWYPLSYYNKRFLPAELNYDVHDKEMVVIVNSFQQWRHFLMGTPVQSVVFTDHKNLEYFNTTKLLSWRQARWAETLIQLNFQIVYHPDKKIGKADAVSCRVDPELEGESEKLDLTIRMFKAGQFQLGKNEKALLTHHVMAVKASQVEESSWSNAILEVGLRDQHWLGIRNAFADRTRLSRPPTLRYRGRNADLQRLHIYCRELHS